MSTPSAPIHGITEHDIAQYLASNPAFFDRHAELLASVQLQSPHGQRAVSLQERQIEMLRERIKGLETKIVEMVRHSQDNAAIAERLYRYTRGVLQVRDAAELPARMVALLKHEFLIPQAALRVFADGNAGDDVRRFANSLTLPYCGVNAGFEAVQWLDEPNGVLSVAMIPLRDADEAFGLLVLGSPDATRYTADMGTEFLARVGEVSSALLARSR